MVNELRSLSVRSTPLTKWVLPYLVIAAICAWQFYGENKKANPSYVSVIAASVILGIIYFFVARRQFSGRADRVLDGGDFIRVAVGAVSEDVPLSNIESVESTTQVHLTVAEIRLKVPGRLGREIVFFPLPRRDADGQNEVVANLRERIAKASAHAI